MILVIVRMTLQSLTPRSKIIKKIVRKLRDVHYTAETDSMVCIIYPRSLTPQSQAPRRASHRGFKLHNFELYNRIPRRNLNRIRKYFSLLNRVGSNHKKMKIENFVTTPL